MRIGIAGRQVVEAPSPAQTWKLFNLTCGSVALSIALAGCGAPSKSPGSPAASTATAATQTLYCERESGVLDGTAAQQLLDQIAKDSVGAAKSRGLIEQFRAGGAAYAEQVFDPVSGVSATLLYIDLKTDKAELLMEGGLSLEQVKAQLGRARADSFHRDAEGTYSAEIKTANGTLVTAHFEVQSCLLSVMSVPGSTPDEVTFAYGIDAAHQKRIKDANDELYGPATTTTGIDPVEDNVAVPYAQSTDPLPDAVNGYEVQDRGKQDSIRVFEGDGWILPLEGKLTATMSCGVAFWVLRWRSANPDVTIKASSGLTDFGEYSPVSGVVNGGAGYLSGKSCVVPALKFGKALNGNESNLADVDFEYRIWKRKPAI